MADEVIQNDVKVQIYQGESGPDKIDFRKSKGQFLGAEQGDHHSTILEARVSEADADAALELAAEIEDIIAKLPKGPAALLALAPAVNEAFAQFGNLQPALAGPLIGMVMGGTGPAKIAVRRYDKD